MISIHKPIKSNGVTALGLLLRYAAILFVTFIIASDWVDKLLTTFGV